MYRLDLSGELLNYGLDPDAPQPPLTPAQLAAVREALMAPHPSGTASGVLDVTALENEEYALTLRLTIDPAVFVGPDVWAGCVQHAQEQTESGLPTTAADTAMESYLSGGPLDELAEIIQSALGDDFSFEPDSSVHYGPLP